METLKYIGDMKLLVRKGFINSSKDPFCEGTVQKPIGNGLTILIRQNREIRLEMNGTIIPNVDILIPSLEKMKLEYEKIEV